MPELLDQLGMTGRERIARDAGEGLELSVCRNASDAYVQHLERVEFGTTGIRYRRLEVRSQLERLPSPLFFELSRAGRLAGTYALSLQPLQIGGADVLGVYRALLTVDDRFKRRGMGHWLVENTLEWIEDSFRVAGCPVFAWGCIESANERSIRLLRTLGAQPVGELQSMLVYRQWPRARGDIGVLDESERAALAGCWRAGVDDCGVVAATVPAGEYVAMRRDGEVVAAARVAVTRLAMQTMGNGWDSLYRHLLRYSGAARRRFDPADFRYLRVSEPLVLEGAESAWTDFVSSLLQAYGLHMAMFVTDPASRQHRLLDRAGVFGRFGAATRQTLQVLGQAWHGDAGLLGEASRRPLAVGPLDL